MEGTGLSAGEFPDKLRPRGENGPQTVFKIIRPDAAAEIDKEAGRGTQVRLVDASLDTVAIELHINRLRPRGARGRVHRHTKSDNVYIVRRGEGTLAIENETHLIRTDDVVFIPAGTRHSLSNLSGEPLELFEIYAPAGKRFDFVVDEEQRPAGGSG